MEQALQYSAYAVGLCLNLMVISALLRGSYRQYPFVFAYAVTLLMSTVIEMGVQAAPTLAHKVYKYYYWADEMILDVLVFCIVIAFIDEAARHSQRKTIERHWLILAATAICAGSFAIHRHLNLNHQMTLISRDLNMCAAVLDMILWSLLASARRPNRRLMLLSGGMGLELSGAIMGEQLRHFAPSLRLTGTLVEVLTGFLGLYIWWRALRGVSVAESAAPA